MKIHGESPFSCVFQNQGTPPSENPKIKLAVGLRFRTLAARREVEGYIPEFQSAACLKPFLSGKHQTNRDFVGINKLKMLDRLVPRSDLTAKRRKEQQKRKQKEQEEEDKDLDSNYYLGLYNEDDEFYKKWSGPVLIGPIFPAILSILIIVAGQLVINGDLGTCGYDLSGNLGI